MTSSPQPSLDENPGPNKTDEPGFLVVGWLTKPHGLNGELVMQVLTDFPERLGAGTEVFVGERHAPMRIGSVRRHKDALIVLFDGVSNRQESEGYRSQWVMVREEDRPQLPSGEYYHHELIGLPVVTREGQLIGKVASILSTGANDVLALEQPEGRELLIPVTDEVLVEIDIDHGKIVVDLIPGIIPE